MQNLWNTPSVRVGTLASLVTGFVWIGLLQHFGHVSLTALAPWIAPLVIILALSGIAVGAFAKRTGGTLRNVFLGTMLGTWSGACAMLPLAAVVVVPLGRLAGRLGLIDRSAISNDIASTLVYVAMLVMWLIVGTVIGVLFVHITNRKSGQVEIQSSITEQGLK